MALKLAIKETMVGHAFPEAYARIENIQGDKKYIYFGVTFHASKDARDALANHIQKKQYDVPTEKFTGLASLYEHLKTLPEFEGAEDC